MAISRTTTVHGLILSAGASSRMGQDKALLEFNGKTLLEDQVGRLRSAGIKNIHVVVGHNHELIIGKHNDLNVTWAINKNWETGRFSSILTGLESTGASNILLLPIDTVGVDPETMKLIIGEGLKTGCNIVPVYDNKGGHPVFLSADFVKRLMALPRTMDQKENMRLDVLLSEDSQIKRLPVASPYILNNINTPDDLIKITPLLE